MLGKPRPFPTRLYAVVSNAPAPEAAQRPRPNITELKREKEAELRTKKAIDRACDVLDQLEARRVTCKSQIALLKERDAAAAKRIERLEDVILERMGAALIDRADGFGRWVAAKACPASLAIDDESLIPEEYLRETLTTAPDKALIKAVLTRGSDRNATAEQRTAAAAIGGVRLVQKLKLVRH